MENQYLSLLFLPQISRIYDLGFTKISRDFIETIGIYMCSYFYEHVVKTKNSKKYELCVSQLNPPRIGIYTCSYFSECVVKTKNSKKYELCVSQLNPPRGILKVLSGKVWMFNQRESQLDYHILIFEKNR